MKNKNFKKDLDCAGFGNAFLWQPYENSLAVEVYFCFGYSLLGCSVSNPLMNSEQVKAEHELMEARRMFNKSKAKKVHKKA